ncbi:MAG: response regulator [Bryobacteraceae bacterium]
MEPNICQRCPRQNPLWSDAEQILAVLAQFPGVVYAGDREGILRLHYGKLALPPEQAVGRSVFDVFREFPAALEITRRALAGQACSHTMRMGPVLFESWCGPIRDQSGEVTGFVGSAIDVTERKKTEEAFRQTKEMLEAVIRSAPLAIVAVDLEKRVTMWNPAAERMYGWTLEEAQGRRLPMIPQDRWDEAGAFHSRVLKEGGITDIERPGVRKDGAPTVVSLSGAPIHNGAGEVTGALYLALDVSERKRAAEALEEAKRRAEAASRAKSEFLANMSHEIRTPMNGVLGMIGLALDTNLTSEQRRYLEVAKSSANSLLAVLNDILDFSKIEARKLTLESVEFDLGTILEEAAEMLAIGAHQKGLELTCRVAPGTPSHLRGDPGRLRQVLVNLAGNAVKFTSRGEVAIQVVSEAEDERTATLRCTVTDTGVGIDPNRLGALFAAFVQADGSTTRKFGGTGLGLAISKQLVELMGGEIGLDSEPGKGSIVWFTVTLEKWFARISPALDAAAGLRSTKALVVEDHVTNLSLVTSLLESWGCRCGQAVDADSALAELRQAAEASDPFRIALLNVGLPGIGGEELGRRIAADPQLAGTALVLMTPLGQPVPASPAFAAHVSKPVLESRLRTALAQALAQNKSRHAPPAAPILAQRDAVPENSRAKILVAEDNPTNQEVAMAILGKLGYDAYAVANGAEAVAALRDADYDLVLMDCEMPEMDGYEATRHIREHGRNRRIPIVALTADAMLGDREKCLQAGMNDYVAKPVQPEVLARVLGNWLRASREEAQSPPVAAPGTSAAFDEREMLHRLMGDRDLAGKIIGGFLEDFPRQLLTLQKRLEEGDAGGVRLQAHTLKGAAATVSAPALRAAALEMEQAGIHGQLPRAARLLPRMQEQLDQFKTTLAQTGWA